MAKEKIIKTYTTTVADGKMVVREKKARADGRVHSAECPYPLIIGEGINAKRLTKKETEKYLLANLGYAA